MRKTFKLYTVAMALLLLLPAAGMAQLKVGYMDPQKVLDALPEKGKIQKELQDYVNQKQQEYNTKYQSFQSRVLNYRNRMSKMNDEENKAAQDSLQSLQQELGQLQQGFNNDLQQKRNTLLAPVLDSMKTAINQVAKEMNLDFVINESTSEGKILSYVSDKGKQDYDITQKVIDKLTKK